MKRHFITIALAAAVLSLGINPSFAADNKADKSQEAVLKAEAAKTAAAHAAQRKANAKIKLVDINSADKTALKTLPGISDTEADKIIAGRPYLSKADLVTKNIISRDVYEQVKNRVIAKQNKATEAKLSEMQKQPKKP